MENKKITFEQFCDPEFIRNEQLKVKTEAIWVTFLELNGVINLSKFAKLYLKKSHSWFSQKLNHTMCNGVPQDFTTEEATNVAAALRRLSEQLKEYADIIDRAE